MFHTAVRMTIRLGLVGAAAALAALVGAASTASAYETGYSNVQLVSMNEASVTQPCSGSDALASITHAYPPEYPQIALEQGVEGSSIITFTMALDGSISDAIVARTSGNRLFDRAAIDAVNKSRFTPATLNCSKIAGVYGVRVVFAQENAPVWPILPFVFGGGGKMILK